MLQFLADGTITAAVEYLLWAFWLLCAGAALVTAADAPVVPQGFKQAVRVAAARGKTWPQRPPRLGWLRVRFRPLFFQTVASRKWGVGEYLLHCCARCVVPSATAR